MRVRFSGTVALLIGVGLSACGDSGTEPDTDPVRAAGVPSGWYRAASPSASYVTGIDSTVRHGGRAAAFVAISAAGTSDWAFLMQAVKADSYRGKRVRLSGWLRPTAVAHGAGLWMRVDGPVFVQAFDNMQNRFVAGTSDWKQYSIVLNVPADAVGISFGVLTGGGPGDLLIDDLKLEEVALTVPTTALPLGFSPTLDGGYASAPLAPVNLGFEAGFATAQILGPSVVR